MTCREFIEFLWRYIEDELYLEEREQFKAHLAECPEYVGYLQSYRETTGLGKIVFTDPEAIVPIEIPEDLVTAILASWAKAV